MAEAKGKDQDNDDIIDLRISDVRKGEKNNNEHGTSEKNSVGSSSSGAGPNVVTPRANMRSRPPPPRQRRRHVEDDEEERGGRSGSGSGATEALSELFIPMGQASRRFDDPHHHQFVPYETVSRTAGKEVEVRHCDIAGHEHRECWACNRADDSDSDHDREDCHGDRIRHQVTRTVSIKRAIRVMAPAGIVEGRQACSPSSSSYASTVGERLLLSTAPAGAMDGLQAKAKAKSSGRFETESSEWAPSPRNPNASFSSEGRTSPNRSSRRPHRRSRQKSKKVEPNSDHNYPSSSYKNEAPTEKSRRLVSGLASAYSSQLPQTSLSSIARARSKETLDALRSYRRMSELPYLPDDCSICATKDNQPSAKLPSLSFKKRDQELERVKQDLMKQEAGIVQSIESIRRTLAEADKNTKGALTDEQSMAKHQSGDDNKLRQVPTFQAKMQAAAAGKKRECEMLESQLRKQLFATQEKLREVQQQSHQDFEPAVDSLDPQEHPDKSQGFGDLQAECDYLRRELLHMKQHLDLSNQKNKLCSEDRDRSMPHLEQPTDSSNVCNFNPGQEHSRLESAQKLVADLRSTLEESQKRLVQLEQSHERHEDELQIKIMEMQDREAQMVKDLQNVQEGQPYEQHLVHEPGVLLKEQSDTIHDGQKELTRITNQLHLTTQQLEALRMEYDSLTASLEQCQILKGQIETLNSELDHQKELTRKWKEESESKEQTLISKKRRSAEIKKELQQSREVIVSIEKAASDLKRDLQLHRDSLSSKELIISKLEKERQQSLETSQSKELRVSELEKQLEEAQESLKSKELIVSGLEEELQQHRECLSSKELIAFKLERDLQQHRESLTSKDQTVAEMEQNLQQHRQSLTQSEEKAQNLQKDLERTQVQVREAHERYSVLEETMKKEAEKHRLHVNDVKTELSKSKETLNDVLAQLETRSSEEMQYRRKSVQDLQEAQEQLRAAKAQLDAKAEEERNLRRKSVLDLQEAQEHLRTVQAQLDGKAEEEIHIRRKSVQDLQEAQEQLRAAQAQLDAKTEEERNLRRKSVQDLQEAQEQLRAVQAQLDGKLEEEKTYRRKSVKDLDDAQEQLQSLQAEMGGQIERERNLRKESLMDLQQAHQVLKELKQLQAQMEGIAEDEKNLRSKSEQELHEAREKLQALRAEMDGDIEKERNLRKTSLMDLQQTQEQLKEMRSKAEEERNVRGKSEQELQEVQEQLRSLREHANKKDEEEKHFRKISIQDLQEAQGKLRTMQNEHRRQITVSTEKMNVVLAQQQDLVEQLENVHEEKKQLEAENEQVLLELDFIRKAFAGLKATLAKHDLCVDFVEDVGEVLKDLHTMIDKHTNLQHKRREEHSDLSDQEFSSKTFVKSSNKSGKVLRDLHTMIDDEKKQARNRREERSESSDQGVSSKVSKLESSSVDTATQIDLGGLDDVTDAVSHDFKDVGDFTIYESPETQASGGDEFGAEEEPSQAVELKVYCRILSNCITSIHCRKISQKPLLLSIQIFKSPMRKPEKSTRFVELNGCSFRRPSNTTYEWITLPFDFLRERISPSIFHNRRKVS